MEDQNKSEIENPKSELKVPTMAQMTAEGRQPDILFWVGCAGSFDERAQKITRDICKILHHVGISYAVLGTEESCTGDPAKRAGNEFLFQMQAITNIEVLNAYNVKKIVTACPHCFNTIKNEYPGLGGNYLRIGSIDIFYTFNIDILFTRFGLFKHLGTTRAAT